MNDPRGSIWRKWDLHVHTPASFHWNGGKPFRDMTTEEKVASLDQIIERMRESDVAAFGIMDYWTFDGYWAVRDHLASQQQPLDKAVFPGMEVRVEAPVEYKLNLQVILSDALTRQQLSDFKGTLRLGGLDRPISDECLIEFAQTLDPSVAAKYGLPSQPLSEGELLELGSMTAKITRQSLEKAVYQVSNSCLIIMPYDTSDGLKNLEWEKHPYDDGYFMQSAHIFETRAPANVDLFLNRETEENHKFISNFVKTMGGKPKPAISGSDAHKISDYGVFPGNRITWIKADPTFEGLLQAVNEPLQRSFVGKIPAKLALVEEKSTKFVTTIRLERKSTATLKEVWFDNTIAINPGLIAIIGNKGKGKSALTDTIGLLGNTKQQEHFTFLSERNFRQPKDNKAKHFQAKLTWASGSTTTKGLDESIDEQEPEVVKYIPQNFLETICTQLGGIEETEFDRELKKVIFSHVPAASRLGRASLDDLIKYKTTEANDELQILRQELHTINERIISLEERSQPDYRQSIENLLKLKNEELEAHEKARPEVIQEPTNDPQKQEEIARVAKVMQDAKAAVAGYEDQIKAAAGKEAEQFRLIAVVDKLVPRVENLERQIRTFAVGSEAEFGAIGLTIQDVVKIAVNKQPLLSRRQVFATAMQEAQVEQNPSQLGSPAQKKLEAQREIENLQTKLDEPNKKYQAYLEALKAWEGRRESIIGDEKAPETIRFYEKQLADLGSLPRRLSEVKSDRLKKAKELHAIIRRLAETYRSLYAPVNQFIESRPLAREKFHLNFEVGVVDSGFENSLFDLISQGVVGTFCGREEGHKRLSEIMARQDFNSEQGIEAFLTEIMDALENDKRPNGGPVRIANQVRSRKTPLELLDFVFGLNYLRPRYSLRMGNKELHQLSPGERGTLLLVFYLLVDKDDVPLVIDQPEENLDNQTVYDLLVPCIKEAKQRRQIFIVTHNPNLAVVCDAEQIIWADLDKQDNYRMKYTSGAIESQILNKATVDILEGTMPAFDNRDSKYFR